MEQVAAIWQDGSDEKSKFERSIMVYPNSGRPQFIRAYYGCYDPLAYPILYPGSETGWEDKSILLEETLMIRFPRNRRKYTKCKTEGMTSFTKLNCWLNYLILSIQYRVMYIYIYID